MEERTIVELQEAMARGEETAVSLVSAYLERIAAIDASGPALNSVLEVNPDALDLAQALDDERRESGARGLLHGIPVLIKGNIDTADRMTTTAGSLALAGSIPAEDAFLVKRLRQAGAIILGKTNLSEWANFRSDKSTSGWSSQGGLTKNPYALDRNPCGSSSGSGAAVAANLCAAAVGTETDGSIVCPANANGIVGLKPTVGLVSRSGIIPISHSQDTAGPMARTVADAAALLNGLVGFDAGDPATADSSDLVPVDYTEYLAVDGLREARIGVARNLLGRNARIEAIMEGAIAILKELGAVIVDPANVDIPEKLERSEFEVLLYEFKAGLDAYLAQQGPQNPVHSLAELIAYNTEHQAQIMPFFGQELLQMALEKGPLSSKAYKKALKTCRRLARDKGLDKVIAQHRLDALIAPTGTPAWVTDLVNGDHVSGSSSSLAAVAGYPSLSLPAGYVFGLPVNISFMAGPWQEPQLIRMGYAFEQAAKVRKRPSFLPTAVLD